MVKQYKLRLVHIDQSIVFVASQLTLRHQLNTTFLKMLVRFSAKSAHLEVHHAIHGWNQVCIERNRYPIIGNPLLLNVSELYRGIVETLAMCDLRPTEEERKAIEEKLKAKERQDMAMARRNRFFVVTNPFPPKK